MNRLTLPAADSLTGKFEAKCASCAGNVSLGAKSKLSNDNVQAECNMEMPAASSAGSDSSLKQATTFCEPNRMGLAVLLLHLLLAHARIAFRAGAEYLLSSRLPYYGVSFLLHRSLPHKKKDGSA